MQLLQNVFPADLHFVGAINHVWVPGVASLMVSTVISPPVPGGIWFEMRSYNIMLSRRWPYVSNTVVIFNMALLMQCCLRCTIQHNNKVTPHKQGGDLQAKQSYTCTSRQTVITMHLEMSKSEFMSSRRFSNIPA